MTAEQVALVALAGFLAGAINAIVGSGSLITFPTLLAIGLPPVTANVTNTVGIVFGSLSAVAGYRREVRRQLRRSLMLSAPTLLGAGTGAALLLLLPPGVFQVVVPVLVALAVLLVLAQPWLTRHLHRGGEPPRWSGWAVTFGVFLTAIYGGYFGAAQGVILMGLLTVLLADPIQELNGVKNVISAEANLVAAIIFVVAAHVAWEAAGVVAVSSIAGGQAGSLLARRMHPLVLRLVIVAAGALALAKLLLG